MIDRYTRGRIGVCAIGGLLSFATAVSAQQDEGTQLRINGANVTLNGRVQTQFNTTTADDLPTTEIAIRRIRLDFGVQVNEMVSGNIQPLFAGGELGFDDAYLQLTFSPGIKFLAGRAHRPFNLFDPVSP